MWILSALGCDKTLPFQSAGCPCEKCGDIHDPSYCPIFGNKPRFEHSDGQPCSVSDRNAPNKYPPTRGIVRVMPGDCDCVYWALTFNGKKAGKF